MAEIVRIPVRDSIGAALRFTRERWRLVLAVAGLGAVLHLFALVGLGAIAPLYFVAVILISAAIYAVLTRAALSGPSAVRANLLGDAGRVAGAGAIIGFFCALIVFIISYVAMSVLIGPYGAEVKAAEKDQAAMQALMERSIAEQPGVVFWSMLACVLAMFLLTSRFYLAAPGSVERGRIHVFEGWRWTRGNLLRIAGARIALLLPALIFVGALQSLVAIAVGIGADSAADMAARAAANPAGFLVLFLFAQFVQIAIYTSLEAGLSAALYRASEAGPAPPPRAA